VTLRCDTEVRHWVREGDNKWWFGSSSAAEHETQQDMGGWNKKL